MGFVLRGIAARSGFYAIGKGQVGLDIQNGRSVQKIRARNNQNAPVLFPFFHSQKLNAGQAYGVGTERGAAGEHADPGIAAKAGRTDGCRPAFSMRRGKIENQPKMGKFFDAAQSFGVIESGLENDFRLQIGGSAALAGYAEFLFEIAANTRDGLYVKSFFHNVAIIPAFFYFVKGVKG